VSAGGQVVADVQRARPAGRGGLGGLGGALELGHHQSGLRLEFPARRRQFDLVRIAGDQLNAQGFLQLLQLCAETRLCQMQALRRAAEMQFLGDREERNQMTELHDTGPFRERSWDGSAAR